MPRILYKYLDITGAKCMIGNQNLQFTNASQLNDPFDCHPKLFDYSNVPESKRQGCIPDEWLKEKEEVDALNSRNETWLCSLSKINDSILMWSHYCHNHKGVCIGLDIDKVMEYVPPMFGVIYLKPLVLDVHYQEIINRPSAFGPSAEQRMYQWTTKAKEWEYEQEVRLVMPKPSFAYAALTPEQAKRPKETWDGREIHHYLPLTGECFESIYLGVNVDPAEKEVIMKYARKKLNPQINQYQMEVDPDAFKLRPAIIHIEEEQEFNQQPKPSPQGKRVPAGAIVGGIVAVVIIVLMIVFSDFLGPILIIGGAAYLLARWLLG